MSTETKTLVITRSKGEKFQFKIEDELILDLLIVSVRGNKVTLSFRASDNIRISTLKDLLIKKPSVK